MRLRQLLNEVLPPVERRDRREFEQPDPALLATTQGMLPGAATPSWNPLSWFGNKSTNQPVVYTPGTGGKGTLQRSSPPAPPTQDTEFGRQVQQPQAQPQVQPSQQRAVNAMQSAATPALNRAAIDPNTNYAKGGQQELVHGLYSAARSNGFSDLGARHLIGEINRENGLNPQLIFGSHTDPANSQRNSGIISWQGDRRSDMLNYLQKNNALDKTGAMVPTQANLNAQFGFMANEMKQSHPEAYRYFSDPGVNFDKNTATQMMGGKNGYIGWALNNPTYRNSGLNNINRGYDIANKYIPPDGANAPGQQNTVAQTQQPNKPASLTYLGDSLASGLGGDPRYAIPGSTPDKVSAMVQAAAKNGYLQGKHVVISTGASNSGLHPEMVQQHVPDMIKAAKDGGASNVTLMGVGPYEHFDSKYGYNKTLGDIAQKNGVNFTGPLASITNGFKSDQIHPNTTGNAAITNHIQANFSKPPANFNPSSATASSDTSTSILGQPHSNSASTSTDTPTPTVGQPHTNGGNLSNRANMALQKPDTITAPTMHSSLHGTGFPTGSAGPDFSQGKWTPEQPMTTGTKPNAAQPTTAQVKPPSEPPTQMAQLQPSSPPPTPQSLPQPAPTQTKPDSSLSNSGSQNASGLPASQTTVQPPSPPQNRNSNSTEPLTNSWRRPAMYLLRA